MNIVFFSTNSNYFDCQKILDRALPDCRSQWQILAKEFPEHNFFVATQLPGSFLIDTACGVFEKSPEGVEYVCLVKETAEELAEEILALKPDVAIAASFWVTPYDWLPVKDSMIASILSERGVTTLSIPEKFSVMCFDKWQTHQFLERLGFNVPKAVYVQHEMFWCERGHKEIKTNVYKEYILSKIKKLKFPVIIKDNTGLSSYGAEVVPTFKAAAAFLLSHKNSSDRIVEEYVPGIQFGCEIHGIEGSYKVLPPFMFSVNKYGITSPKQSVKIGPVASEKYNIDELTGSLLLIANELQFSGIIQLDLVFSEGKWYVLEINPRLSGMSQIYASLDGKSIFKILTGLALKKAACAKKKSGDNITDYPGNFLENPLENYQNCEELDCEKQNQSGKVLCNIKMSLMPDEQINDVYELPYIEYIHQIQNLAATQKRETGYCEVNVSAKDFCGLEKNLKNLAEKFPAYTEVDFIQKASELIKLC